LFKILILKIFIFTLTCSSVNADVVRVAIASNFVSTFNLISEKFEKKTGHEIKSSPGSTGKHYAQIINGAPFDLFFAGDSRRPRLLEDQGRVFGKERFTYALGKLLLWSSDPSLIDKSHKILKDKKVRYIAIANPKLAPYGLAAKEYLISQNLWPHLKGRLVYGENIGQTYNFIRSGNAKIGFIAMSQYMKIKEGSFLIIPGNLYSPIKQQVVLLTKNNAAIELLEFIQTDSIKKIIQKHGYGTL
jgi:molybdate transport system substrate-binding protein